MPDLYSDGCVEEAKTWKEAYMEAERLQDEFFRSAKHWLVAAGGTIVVCNPGAIASGWGALKCSGGVGVSWDMYWDAIEKQETANNAARTADALLRDFNECFHTSKMPWFEP